MCFNITTCTCMLGDDSMSTPTNNCGQALKFYTSLMSRERHTHAQHNRYCTAAKTYLHVWGYCLLLQCQPFQLHCNLHEVCTLSSRLPGLKRGTHQLFHAHTSPEAPPPPGPQREGCSLHHHHHQGGSRRIEPCQCCSGLLGETVWERSWRRERGERERERGRGGGGKEFMVQIR